MNGESHQDHHRVSQGVHCLKDRANMGSHLLLEPLNVCRNSTGSLLRDRAHVSCQHLCRDVAVDGTGCNVDQVADVSVGTG